jgi:hypothetical protein
VQVLTLRNARAGPRRTTDRVGLDHDDPFSVAGKNPRSEQPGDAAPEHASRSEQYFRPFQRPCRDEPVECDH